MANMSGKMRIVGGYMFLAVLWMTGWGFMWIQLFGGTKDAMAKVPADDIMGLMVALPAGLMMKIKLWTVAYEGFTYSGFSFFPALPWDSIKVPPWSPSPADIFLSGIFQFEGCDDEGDEQARQGSCVTHYVSFFGAVLFVPLAYLVLYLVRNHTGRFMLVVEIAFAALTFPAIKQFTDVFSCTSGTISRVSRGNLTRVCDPNILPTESCMDVEPSIVCWGHDHFVHVVCVMLVLVPYYMGSLFLRTDSQAKSSAVIIDGTFSVVAFQAKMVLAVVASGFGDCHPLIIVCTVELVVIVIGLMSINHLTGRRFSNVVSLNVVRIVGIVAAAGNGMYGMYITSQYGTDACATTDNTFTQFGRRSKQPRGATWVEGNNGEAGYWNTTALEERKVASYTEFMALIVLNVGVCVFGIFYFKYKRRTLQQVKMDARKNCERDNPTCFDQQVDYPLIHFRLEAETQKVFKLWVSEERDDFASKRQEEAKGQQIEDVTLDLVLFQAAPRRRRRWVDEIEIVQILEFDVRTNGGHRLRAKLDAIITEGNPSDRCGRFWVRLKRAISKVTCGRACSTNKLRHRLAIKFAEKEEALGFVANQPEDIETPTDANVQADMPNSPEKSGAVSKVFNQAKRGAKAMIKHSKAILGSDSAAQGLDLSNDNSDAHNEALWRHDHIQRVTQGKRIKMLTDLMDPCVNVTDLDISGTNCKTFSPVFLFVACVTR
jgi:hypothetical protein